MVPLVLLFMIKHLDQITNILLVFSVINSSSREGSVCDIFPFYCCFFTESQVTAGSVDFRLLGCSDLVGEWKSSRILENKAKTGKRMNCGHCVAASGLAEHHGCHWGRGGKYTVGKVGRNSHKTAPC